MCRFSDEELQKLYKEFQDHVAEFKEHVQEEKSYREENDVVLHRLVEAQEANTKAVQDQIKATKGVVSIYDDMAAGGRIAAKIGAFAKWLASLAIFVALYHFFYGK